MFLNLPLMTKELPLMVPDVWGLVNIVYVVPYAKFWESSIVVAVAVVILTDMLLAPVRYGAEEGALSVTLIVNDCCEVPPVFTPLTRTAYDWLRYAPMIFRMEPDRDAEFCGLDAIVYDVASVQYGARSVSTADDDVSVASVRLDVPPDRMGSVGVSVTRMDRLTVDVPVIFDAETRIVYVVFRKAPWSDNV